LLDAQSAGRPRRHTLRAGGIIGALIQPAGGVGEPSMGDIAYRVLGALVQARFQIAALLAVVNTIFLLLEVHVFLEAPSGTGGLGLLDSPLLLAAAVLLIVGFALAGALLVTRLADKTEVLVAARPVPAGHVITAEDVGTASVAGSIRVIPAARLGTVVGETAAVPLAAGQVLNRDMLTDQPVPGVGQAMVGLALKPGQLPADGVSPGDRVRIVAVPVGPDEISGGEPASPPVLADDARVYAIRTDPAGAGTTLMTVIVPAAAGPRVATVGAVGRAGVVEVSAR
jgi:hypothetical protein